MIELKEKHKQGVRSTICVLNGCDMQCSLKEIRLRHSAKTFLRFESLKGLVEKVHTEIERKKHTISDF